MAGHSKWANIKRRKEAQDAQKAKVFTQITREIIVATQRGGPQVATNPALRQAVQRAKAAKLPKANILRAIQKGSGAKGTILYESVVYEGYALGGVGILVEATTDNKNRTVAYLRALFNKYGGRLDKKGALQHLFDHTGYLLVAEEQTANWDQLTLALLDMGVIELEIEHGYVHILCKKDQLAQVRDYLKTYQIAPQEADIRYIPHTACMVVLNQEQANRLQRLYNDLEALEDVQQVYCNAIWPQKEPTIGP